LSEKLPEIALENAPDGQIIVPVPIASGGVDIVVPAPSRIRIPYENHLPVRVQFSCVAPDGKSFAECPIRVMRERDGVQSEIKLKGTNPNVHFDLAGSSGSVIVLEIGQPSQPPQPRLAIRNWVMLPSEMWQ